jgi:ribonuclease D
MHSPLMKANLSEEFRLLLRRLEQKEFQRKKNPHMRIGGARSLNDKARVRLKHLYHARDEIARLLDFPPFWVLRNSVLLRFARKPPRSAEEWEKRGHLPKKGSKYIPLLVSAIAEAEIENAESR